MSSRTLPALPLCLPLLLALAAPALATAAPPPPPDPTGGIATRAPVTAARVHDAKPRTPSVHVAVVADLGAPEADDAAAAALQRSITEHLRASRFVVDDAAGTHVTVFLTWKGADKTTYAAALVVAGNDHGEPSELDRVVCPTCGSQQLVAAVVDMLDQHADALRAAAQSKSSESIAAAPAVRMDSPPQPSVPLRAKRIGPLGIGGAVMLGSGAALAITGAGLLGRSGDRIVLPGDPRRRTVDDLRIPGGVTLGVGVGLAISGAAMLGADLVRRGRGVSRPRVVAAQIGPKHLGFTVFGRF